MNCRGMETSVFTTPEVSGLLSNFVEARLHTDNDNPNIEQILELQRELTGTKSLPVYVIVDPATERRLDIGTSLGNPLSPGPFIDFLQRNLTD